MSICGSFSEDSLMSFMEGMENPANFMAIAPAMRPAPATPPSSFLMDEDDESCGCEGGYDDDDEEAEPNARMAMGQLKSMMADIAAILGEMTPDDYLEPWVAAKITMSKQNLSAVADYLQFND